jgi:HSP20 family protein
MLRSLTTRRDNPFVSWQREMNDWFDKFNREIDVPLMEMEEFSPKVELRETDKGYSVRAEIPGISESDVNVTLRENNLILEGEKKTETKKEERGHYFSEFSYGSFYRSIPLEEEVNPDKVKATYRNGILNVELEKIEGSTGSKKIPIMRS